MEYLDLVNKNVRGGRETNKYMYTETLDEFIEKFSIRGGLEDSSSIEKSDQSDNVEELSESDNIELINSDDISKSESSSSSHHMETEIFDESETHGVETEILEASSEDSYSFEENEENEINEINDTLSENHVFYGSAESKDKYGLKHAHELEKTVIENDFEKINKVYKKIM